MQMWGIEMTEKPKDVEKYFENSKCKMCGVVVQPHFQGNTKLPKEEHLAKEHSDLEWTIRKKWMEMTKKKPHGHNIGGSSKQKRRKENKGKSQI